MKSARDVIAEAIDQTSPNGVVDGGVGQADTILAALAAAGHVVAPKREWPASPVLLAEARIPDKQDYTWLVAEGCWVTRASIKWQGSTKAPYQVLSIYR